MPFRDPDPDFNPLLAQHEANAALRGFEHSGEQAEQLEREAQHQRHAPMPGGGVRVTFTLDPDAPDESTDLRARLRALGHTPRASRLTGTDDFGAAA